MNAQEWYEAKDVRLLLQTLGKFLIDRKIVTWLACSFARTGFYFENGFPRFPQDLLALELIKIVEGWCLGRNSLYQVEQCKEATEITAAHLGFPADLLFDPAINAARIVLADDENDIPVYAIWCAEIVSAFQLHPTDLEIFTSYYEEYFDSGEDMLPYTEETKGFDREFYQYLNTLAELMRKQLPCPYEKLTKWSDFVKFNKLGEDK